MNTDLFASVDLYCERTGAAFWSEPANALTNVAFIAAGIWGVYEVRKRSTGTAAEALAWWVVVIGIGSAAFHTFANRLTILGDVIPIAVFAIAYPLFNLRRFVGMSWARSILVLVAFYVVACLVTYLLPMRFNEMTNRSTAYLPAFLALISLGILNVCSGSPAGRYNLAAACIFGCAVTFRIIDPAVCAAFPLGTHFLWHTLNGLVLGVILAAVARYGAPDQPTERPQTLWAPAA